MRWYRPIIYIVFLSAAVAALAAWQKHEYDHECELAGRTLRRQADSVMKALVGGISSHRRFGPYFDEQLQGALDELAFSEDILAVAIVSADGEFRRFAGDQRLLDASPPLNSGESWQPGGFRFVVAFHLEPGSRGGDRGPGGGRGWGRAMRPDPPNDSPLAAGGDFAAILVLDRAGTDAFCQRAFWLRFWVVTAGAVVLLCMGLVWWATIHTVRAHGRAQVLEAETRHLREMSQAAAGLAHETRNPLGVIRGWSQRLLQAGLGSGEQRQQVQTVLEECDRVTARINQFLAFARPTEPSLETVDVDRLIDALAVLLEPDLEATGLRLERTPSERSALAQADREMLRQALFNLAANAIHFAPEGGTVEISVAGGQDEGFRIEVADRGPGVPSDKVDSLFTPYFTTRPDGTGLGLAIVRRIAAAHGWQAGYTPRHGGGSIFWIDRIHG